ncbi:hypothetical protein D3C84_1186420 [compost metagenome]
MLNTLKEIVKHNQFQLNLVEGDQGSAENLYTISHNEMDIYDFFSDETLMEDVNPLEYYDHNQLQEVVHQFNLDKA